ncbi:MAG TPA: PA2169 family four-helix-bundle protein [Methylocystis sp.]|nr:PA2169 family four-helix-bundle protein [Methylocystis sp.]
MNKAVVISTLNTLLTLTRDGEADFNEAAGLVVNLKIQDLLRKAAGHCRDSAGELAKLIEQQGGDPEQGPSLAGAAHVAWTDLKSKIVGITDEEILDECLSSEETARSIFEEALAAPLPEEAKALVAKQYEGVKRHYELVRGLRSSFVYGRT